MRSTFADEVVNDPAVRALIARIRMELDARWKDDGEFATEVVVETEDGARLSRFVALAQGKPARWFSPQRLHAKFSDCAAAVMDEPRREAAWRALARLGSTQGCATLLRTLGNLPPP